MCGPDFDSVSFTVYILPSSLRRAGDMCEVHKTELELRAIAEELAAFNEEKMQALAEILLKDLIDLTVSRKIVWMSSKSLDGRDMWFHFRMGGVRLHLEDGCWRPKLNIYFSQNEQDKDQWAIEGNLVDALIGSVQYSLGLAKKLSVLAYSNQSGAFSGDVLTRINKRAEDFIAYIERMF